MPKQQNIFFPEKFFFHFTLPLTKSKYDWPDCLLLSCSGSAKRKYFSATA